ncbi:protein FAM214A-like isoform X2 [Amphibalanus amphitrite]|uniref:protein FAM214A-like isoform X2 n=1 Tax=Amphibalanus amphitrite TaxID=1232801 RepID=UPI001C919599|nr:protein FAM214A-like isoform X2 [Amphibalanus amphitrite]
MQTGDGAAVDGAAETTPSLLLTMAHAVRPDMEAGAEEPEPSELFGDLGTLVVEGRTPGGQRGFHEGPHCVLVYPYRQNKHVCDANSVVCQRESELRRYMYLLWRNNIPMSVEVLLCPPCCHGRSRAAAVDATPEPGYLLLEQWTVHMETATRCHRSSVGARALLQAVYSYLHFSQLSAWLSRSGGAVPSNVMYRITVPGDAFGTRFAGGTPQLHTFPTAYLARDRTLVQVSVRALPRCDAVPSIPCASCRAGEVEQPLGACAAPLPAPPPGPAAGADAATDQWTADDLRRSIIKCRLQGALSDSRDSLLGDSLLDPPRSLHKYPKRYQSPSRSGSPSLETPEHLMFGGSRESSTERRADTLSRRVITDQCAAPDLAWTQGRATWRSDASPPPPQRPDLYRHRRSPSREHRRGHFYEVHHAPAPGGSSPLDGSDDAHRSPRQSRRSYKDEYRVPPDGERTVGEPKEERLAAEPAPAADRLCQSERRAQQVQTERSQPVPRRSPQRSRSDCSAVFRLTPDETQQVVAVLRHSGPPPSPPAGHQPATADNPLLSAIERAGQVDARTVRMRTSHFLARTSPVSSSRLTGQQEARPLLSPGRSADGTRLVRLVRRALSFEQPPAAPERTDPQPCPPLESARGTDGSRSETVAVRGRSERVPGGASPRVSDAVSERLSNGSSDRAASRVENMVASGSCERVSNGSCERISNGASERTSNGLCERVSNGSCEVISNGSCETISNGSCERVSNGSGERVSNGSSERTSNGHGVSDAPSSDRTGDGDLLDDSGTSALNRKGSRNLKSNNLIKRLFKKEEPEPEEEGETQQRQTLAGSSASRAAVRRSLDLSGPAAFSQKTGLPLNSSPAPLRRGNAFQFDAALTKVKTFSSALNELAGDSGAGDSERDGRQLSASCPAGVVSPLLGSFEESVLNGRLGPVSTVEGFSADIGASGSFQPKHIRLPVTVFFYSLSDNEKIASPYMGHVQLGRKGYHVPKKGTLQVTLFNPHGTVVKMFVVMYDLSAMPPGCQTFLRQRTLYMPVGESPEHPDSQKWLRYLIHLRFATGRTGRVYVHTDLRMIIFRKSDMDAAAVHTSDSAAHEMRSFVHMPDNPRYSPRK